MRGEVMKKYRYFISVLILLLVSGCQGDVESNREIMENNRLAREACIDSGGVPIQSLFNANILGSCIYKSQTEQLDDER